MSLILIPVKIHAAMASGAAVAGASVRAVLTVAELDDGLVVPAAVTGTTDSNGDVTLNLWPNSRGVNGSQYRIVIESEELFYSGLVTVPEIPSSGWPILLESIVNLPPYPQREPVLLAQEQAQQNVLLAQAYRNEAQAWAESPTPPDPSDPTSKSAKTHNAEAGASAAASDASRALADAWARSDTPPDPADPSSKSAKKHSLDAAADALAAHNDRLAADGDAASALNARLAAEAAANATGPTQIYATKAAANTALAGLANGAIVEVVQDESQNYRRTRYQKTSGAYVFLLYMDKARTWYWNTATGSDANDGLTPSTPKATWSAISALLGEGDTILCAGGGRFFGSVVSTIKHLYFDVYGHSGKFIVDGSRAIPSASWTANGDGTYTAVITHEVAPDATSVTGLCLWREKPSGGRPVTLAPKWTAGSIAANKAAVLAGTDLFTCNRTGSTTADPRSDTFGTSYTYTVKPPAGYDPTTSNITYYYAEAKQVITMEEGWKVRNIVAQRTAFKDMTGLSSSNGKAALIEYFELKEAAQHGFVGGAILVRNSDAFSRPAAGDFNNQGGGGWHMFNSLDGAANNYVARLERCTAWYFGKNFYSHAGNTAVADNIEVEVVNCESYYSQALACGIGQLTTRGVHIRGFRSLGDKGGFALPANSDVENFVIRLKDPTSSAFMLNGNTGGSVSAKNGTVICNSSAPGTLASNQTATDTAHRLTLNLTNVTAVNVVFNASAFLRQIDHVWTDCVFGNLETQWNATPPFLSVTASNSAFAMYRMTLTEIQARAGCSGVDSTNVIPWRDHKFTKTIVDAADLRYVNSGQSVQFSAVDTISFNTQSGTKVNDYITIVNYKGTGTDFKTRIVAGSGNGPFTISPAADAYTTGFKTCNVAMFNRKVFQAGTTGVTAVFSDDGTQAYLSDVTNISVNTVLYFGAIGRRDPIGSRKVTALTGQTATLDKPVSWRQMTADLVAYAALGSAGNPRPSVSVSFGFPLRPVENVSGFPTVMTYTIDRTAAGLTASNGYENPGSGGKAVFTSATSDLLKANGSWDSQGNAVTAGQIHHETGEIDCGFAPLGPGDVLTVSTAAYADDRAPQFAADPFMSGSAALKPGSFLANMGIGSKIQ